MEGSDVKLIGGWASPFTMRARVALNLKNVDYEFLEEQLGSKSELLLKSNPVHKKMPVMIHKDRIICESLLIVQYIDEVFTSGLSILPSDPYDCAVARFWAAYIDDKWFKSLHGIGRAKTDEEKASAVKEMNTGLGLLEEAFHKISQGKGFFGGDRLGYLDIALGSCLGWLKVTEKYSGLKYVDEIKTPGLFGWEKRFCSDDSVKDVMPETDKLVEFATMLMTKLSLST